MDFIPAGWLFSSAAGCCSLLVLASMYFVCVCEAGWFWDCSYRPASLGDVTLEQLACMEGLRRHQVLVIPAC